MVDSGLRISLDPLYPPPNINKRTNYQIPATFWELVFDNDIDSKELDEIFEKYQQKQDGINKNEKELEDFLIREEDQEEDFD